MGFWTLYSITALLVGVILVAPSISAYREAKDFKLKVVYALIELLIMVLWLPVVAIIAVAMVVSAVRREEKPVSKEDVKKEIESSVLDWIKSRADNKNQQ